MMRFEPMTTRDERSVDIAIEVRATPEEVWDVIATGPGISKWFVPAEIEDDTIHFHHPNGFEQDGTITVREPPHRFRVEFDAFAPTPETDPLPTAIEVTVAAQSGGTSVIRLVNSGFGSGADWDEQIESSRAGWERCLQALRDLF